MAREGSASQVAVLCVEPFGAWSTCEQPSRPGRWVVCPGLLCSDVLLDWRAGGLPLEVEQWRTPRQESLLYTLPGCHLPCLGLLVHHPGEPGGHSGPGPSSEAALDTGVSPHLELTS